MTLSPRELQIAALLQQGKTKKQIDQVLGLSQHTVLDNINPMFARFGVKTRVALVAIPIQWAADEPANPAATIRRTADRCTSDDRRATSRSVC